MGVETSGGKSMGGDNGGGRRGAEAEERWRRGGMEVEVEKEWEVE